MRLDEFVDQVLSAEIYSQGATLSHLLSLASPTAEQIRSNLNDPRVRTDYVSFHFNPVPTSLPLLLIHPTSYPPLLLLASSQRSSTPSSPGILESNLHGMTSALNTFNYYIC